MNTRIVMSCVEKGCKNNTEIGDLLFCRYHRSRWYDICFLSMESAESIIQLESIRNKRLALARGI